MCIKWVVTYFLLFLSYFRAIILLPFAILQFFILCLLSVAFSIFRLPKVLTHIMLENFWAKPLLVLLNIDLKIKGRENLPLRSKSVLYLFNHSSVMDIPLLLLVTPHVYFGAKASLFRIPIFGWAMKLYGALKIYRMKGKETVTMYKEEASKRAILGDSFALAPEGGRKSTANSLAKFKVGPFLLAFFAQIPVVPVIIIGAQHVLPKSTLFFCWGRWKSTLEIHILPSQAMQNYEESSVEGFRDEVQLLMHAKYVKCVQASIKSI